MTKSILTFALLFSAITGFSQLTADSTKRTKEFLITTTSLTSGNYGLQYKVQVFKKSFLRIGLTYLYSNYLSEKPLFSTSFPTKNYGGGLSFISGIEKRKPIAEVFEFSYGLNLIFSGSWTNTKSEDPNLASSLRNIQNNTISTGIGIDLGAIMKINRNFYLGAEIVPRLMYSYSQIHAIETNEKQTMRTFNTDINSQNATLALIYRFK